MGYLRCVLLCFEADLVIFWLGQLILLSRVYGSRAIGEGEDVMRWNLSASGTFHVKS